MSPKAPDPQIRTALIEAAARLLAEEGPEALTTRRLAREVGTSTMAVYTYFDGMNDLRHAILEEGFARFSAFLAQVPIGDDPIAELTELGGAYFINAVTNPHLYRFMFTEKKRVDADVGMETFERLVESVDRAIKAGRLRGEAWSVARQMWAMSHGVVTLYLSELLTLEEAIETFQGMGLAVMVGLGDDPKRTEESVAKGRGRFADFLPQATGAPA
jgi:AcrR family transcriptional regulator